MSLLTPLYVLGLAAISLPVIFHLIRRMPRGEFQFSSLMFLSPSPPRLTRRSRLENILLLVLRGAVLSLLAFAFARPFLRQTVPPGPSDADERRVAIVVDTSASMRRGDLWQQATAMVDKVVSECRPHDQIALFACDDVLRPLASFEDLSQVPLAQRQAVVSGRIRDVEPTWAGTSLGRGLMDAVEIVNNVTEKTDRQNRTARRVVLVSDMQQGGRLNALSDYPWPEDVELELRPVQLAKTSNAGLHRLADEQPVGSEAAAGELRVRVSNDEQSTADEFQLEWINDSDQPVDKPVAVYVPPGESRVVRVRRPKTGNAGRLRLSGDDHDFDNTLHFATRAEAERSVIYFGTDRPNDPQGLRYYLERALTDGLAQPVKFVAAAPDSRVTIDSPTETPLVVATSDPAADTLGALRQYLETGGTMVFVLTGDKPATAWASLANQSATNKSEVARLPSIEEANVTNYTMLGQIAFEHPLFAPMAGPHFNDFTQIRFWKYRKLSTEQLGGANLVARFESGDPALAEWRVGKGRLYVLTTGWHPADSQLARSWKFVLLVSALVEGGRGGPSDRVYFVVNEPVPVPESENDDQPPSVTKPDGTQMRLARGTRSFEAADVPGVYSLTTADGPQQFAVNLDPMESRTAAVGVESLEQLGCRLVGSPTLAHNENERLHLQDLQLESRQKIWQWLIVSALGLLVAETWLAGRATKPVTEGTSA
jgi:hypothetical protein